MFFNNKFNTFFGLNLTLVYTFPMCMTWRFHFPLRNYDFKVLGQFSIIYFRGLGLRIGVRVWVRVRVGVRVWVRVMVRVRVRVSVVLWSG